MTLGVKKLLEQRREDRRRSWEAGAISDWDAHTHAMLNAANIGECRAYAYVQELNFEQFDTEIEDE